MKNRYIATSTVKVLLRRLFRLLFSRFIIYDKMLVFETNLEKPNRFKQKKRTDIVARFAQDKDIPRLESIQRFRGLKAKQRLEDGHICFLIEKNGKIANYTWVCFKEAFVDELEMKIRINPYSAYRYDTYTLPEFRGLGIFTAVLAISSECLSQMGFRRVYELVDWVNYSSLRSHAKAGSRKLGRITYIKLFGSKKYIFECETPNDYAKLIGLFPYSLI